MTPGQAFDFWSLSPEERARQARRAGAFRNDYEESLHTAEGHERAAQLSRNLIEIHPARFNGTALNGLAA